jgi:GTP-binding protein
LSVPLFRQARFLKSAQELLDLPEESQREIAFAGRSNSGKSSVINTLADQRQLARVSKTPGRTQLLNYFGLGDGRFFVDLPGYGYAKVPVATRAPWGRILGEYLQTRSQLAGLALIMDVRHPLTELDWGLLRWFGPTGKPVHVLLTKADKLSRSASLQTLREVRLVLAEASPNWTAQLFSSLKRTGIEDAEAVLKEWLVADEHEEADPEDLPVT